MSPDTVGVYGLDGAGPLSIWYHPMIDGKKSQAQRELHLERDGGPAAAPRAKLAGFL